MTAFPILEGDEWGMRWDRPPIPQTGQQPTKYVHHSAGNPFATITAAEAFRRMNEMAIAEGMSAIDYTLMVHEHPGTDTVTIGVARGEWLPAATYAQNVVSKAVCALGYFHPGHALSAVPSARMIEGIARACALLIERGWCSPVSRTLGHRDSPAAIGSRATSCPGDELYPHVPWIHARALELTAGPPLPDPEPPAPPAPILEDLDMLFICKVAGVIFVGDGVRSSEVPPAALPTLETNMRIAPRWRHPARRELPVLTELDQIPEINATQRDLLVGRVV